MRDWKAPALAVFGLAALAVAVPIGFANAQATDTRDGQSTTYQRSDERATVTQRADFALPDQDLRPMMRDRMIQGMAMGPTTMVADTQFLYILRGNDLIKVDKDSLQPVGHGQIPGPMGPTMAPIVPPAAPGIRSGGGHVIPPAGPGDGTIK